MTKFMLKPGAERMWKHQNNAVPVECFDGVLVDNTMYACKRGYCAAYEQPLNEWSSTLVYEFAPYDDTAAVNALWDEFLERMGDSESAWLTWGAA